MEYGSRGNSGGLGGQISEDPRAIDGPRSVPMAISAIDHAIESLNERLAALYKRLEDGGVLRPEPPPGEKAPHARPTLPCGLANAVADQAERMRRLAVGIEHLTSRLEV